MRMTIRSTEIGTRAALVAAAVMMTACAHVPTGPSVMALAGSGKTLEQFQTDDRTCRQSAAQELETTRQGEVPAQRRYDMAYLQCMYAKGHQIPIPGGRPSYTSSTGAATTQAECERRGGVWRPASSRCEIATPPR